MSSTVLYVIADSSRTGGPMSLRNLARCLPPTLNIHCFCPPGWLSGEMTRAGATVHTRAEHGSRRSLVVQIRKVVREVQPDVVHLHGVRAGILGATAADGRGPAMVYTEMVWTADYAPMLSRIRAAIQLFLLCRVAARMDRVVCMSQTVADFLAARKIAAPEKLRVIYPGVEMFSPVGEVETPAIGTLGTLNWMKGTDLLLRALPRIAERHPEVVCRIGGCGPREAALKALAKQLGVERHVEWCGEIEDVAAFFSQLQLYIHPSRNESFGIAPVEAMSAGLPVIASRAGSLPEVVPDGVGGLLFPAEDAAELARLASDLLADRDKRARLALRGREHAQQFTEQAAAEEHLKLYEELVDGAGTP